MLGYVESNWINWTIRLAVQREVNRREEEEDGGK